MRIFIAYFAAMFMATLSLPDSARADQAHLDTIREQCGIQLKMTPKACKCIADKAAVLSDSLQAFVVAMITKNKREAANIQAKLTVEEQVEAGKFMTSAPGQCAKQ